MVKLSSGPSQQDLIGFKWKLGSGATERRGGVRIRKSLESKLKPRAMVMGRIGVHLASDRSVGSIVDAAFSNQ